MSVMQVIVLYPCTKFEVCRPSLSDCRSRHYAAWWAWPLIFEVTSHAGDAGHRTPSAYHAVWYADGVWSLHQSASWPWPLTFQPVNGVTCHPCHVLPANFQLLTPFRSQLRIRHRTDKQTAISALCCHPGGRDMIMITIIALCRFCGCKNRPTLFPVRILYKATKPGLVLFYILACFNYIIAY